VLERGRSREHAHVAEVHGVAGQRGEVGQECAEAVDRLAIVGFTARALARAVGETSAGATGEAVDAAAGGGRDPRTA
jgi:hypothetical protein